MTEIHNNFNASFWEFNQKLAFYYLTQNTRDFNHKINA